MKKLFLLIAMSTVMIKAEDPKILTLESNDTKQLQEAQHNVDRANAAKAEADTWLATLSRRMMRKYKVEKSTQNGNVTYCGFGNCMSYPLQTTFDKTFEHIIVY